MTGGPQGSRSGVLLAITFKTAKASQIEATLAVRKFWDIMRVDLPMFKFHHSAGSSKYIGQSGRFY